MCSLRSLALNYRRVKQATALSRVFNNQPRGIIIGERAKRARRYLVMFMETRDILCTSVSNTHERVSVLPIKFKSKETEDFLA